MGEVTREDVASKVSDALAPLLGQQPTGPTGVDFAVADALIAAFPHLVGEVETIGTRYLEPEFGARATATQVVYTVAGGWSPVPTDGNEN